MPALTGRALVAAMCLGQVGSLLPHVVVPAIMAQHLMPLWELSTAQAGLMASAYAFGYMLAVPVLTTLTDRIDARRVLMVGSASSGIATALFGLSAYSMRISYSCPVARLIVPLNSLLLRGGPLNGLQSGFDAGHAPVGEMEAGTAPGLLVFFCVLLNALRKLLFS